MKPHLDRDDLPDIVVDELRSHGLEVELVDKWLREHGSDGATGVADGYLPAAWLHDYCYRTAVVDRATADRWYRLTLLYAAEADELPWRAWAWCRAWWRWAFLRAFSSRFYRHDLREDR